MSFYHPIQPFPYCPICAATKWQLPRRVRADIWTSLHPSACNVATVKIIITFMPSFTFFLLAEPTGYIYATGASWSTVRFQAAAARDTAASKAGKKRMKR